MAKTPWFDNPWPTEKTDNTMKNTTHTLKTWPELFNQILIGIKKYEIRKDDRGFKVGDELILAEWDPEKQEYTDRVISVIVTSKLEGGQLGIKEGYCAMGIRTI